MKSRGYISEKMNVAISCMCGDGTFKQRLENATMSALILLEDDDLFGDSIEHLSGDLTFILNWTKRNMVNGIIQQEPDKLQRKQLIEKMIRVLNASSAHE